MATRRYDIALPVGSLKRQSLTRRLAAAAASFAPPRLHCSQVEIGGLPFYDEDLDANPAQPGVDFRARLVAAHGVVVFMPEYNRSIPSGLKNAVDVGSRPYDFSGKPAAMVSQSSSPMGGINANMALLQFLSMPVIKQFETYLANNDGAFGESGTLGDSMRDRPTTLMAAGASWIARPATTCC